MAVLRAFSWLACFAVSVLVPLFAWPISSGIWTFFLRIKHHFCRLSFNFKKQSFCVFRMFYLPYIARVTCDPLVDLPRLSEEDQPIEFLSVLRHFSNIFYVIIIIEADTTPYLVMSIFKFQAVSIIMRVLLEIFLSLVSTRQIILNAILRLPIETLGETL